MTHSTHTRFYALILCLLPALLITACGGTQPSPPVNNPVPSITSLLPSSAEVGTAAQTLTINGTNFVAGSTVTYNGVAHTATFVSASQLTIQLSAGDQSTAGSYPVVVTNPAPGGGSSNTVNFAVIFPVPAITSLFPSSALVGSAAQTLTINGSNFVSSSTVTYNGVAHTATFVSASQLTIQLSASDQSAAGSYPVVVTNPAPGGGDSNTVNFAVTLPAPTITSLAPSSALVGSAAQTLTINGTNFVSGATVTYNGVAHTATFVNSTQLTITLSTADQATAGVFPVVVTNPDNQSTSAANFTVNNPAPTITNLAPASTFPCDAVSTLTINGTNFLASSTVTFNGSAKTVTFVNSTQLTIPLTTSDIATPGSFNVVVTNAAPGGGVSAAVSFVVNTPLGPTLQGTGPLGAVLKVYAVGAAGTNGALLCTSTTDSQTGTFSVTLDAPLVAINVAPATVAAVSSGSVRLVTTGGQIIYLGITGGVASSTLFAETSPDSALLDSVPVGGVSGIAIGMPSTFVDSLVQGNLAHGKATTVVGSHASATKLFNGLYGFSGATAIELIPAGGSDGLKRELAEQGVLTEGLQLAPNSPGDLRGALAADIADGSWDGLAFGQRAAFETGNLPATAGTTDFLSATVSWVNGPGTVQLPAGTTAPTPSLVQGVTTCTCTPFGVGLSPGNTGGIAPLAFNAHQYIFFAAGVQGVVAVDVSDPTASSPTIKAWPSVATTFGGHDVSGVAAIVGNADHPQIFAFTGSDKQVAVLNAQTLANGNPATDNPVEFHGQLSFTATSAIALSGSTWWITGAFWDGCLENCRVIMATADGYTDFNPANDQLDESQLFPVQDTNQTATGNMGPDIFTGINVASPTARTDSVILAGNPGGIQLVDFKSNASFYVPLSTVVTYFPSFPAIRDVRFDDGDGNAMDPILQVGLLTPEGVNSVVGLLNLNGITETTGATADKNTFTPAGTAQVTLAQATFAVEGSSINPTVHQALLMGPSSVFTVAQIQDPAAVPAGQTWSGFSDWSFYDVSNSPSLSAFTLPNNDIHALTTVTSLGIVKLTTLNLAYGYWMDGSGRLVLQVDLNAFLSLQRQGTTGDAAHQPTGDPATATNATTGGTVLGKITW